MKRNLFFSLLLFVLVPFVSAQYYGAGFWYGTEQVIDSVVMNLEPLFRALLGGYDWSGYLLFEKTLLFILISIIVGLILNRVPVFQDKAKKIINLISIIIGLLAVRNLNYIWIGTILVQYQVLFITVAGFLPFMLYWFFVSSLSGMENSWIRKAAWVFYAVIYFGLWSTTDLVTYAEVYLWGAFAALGYAFFIDTWLMRWLAVREARLGDSSSREKMVADLKKDIENIRKLHADSHLGKESAEHLIKKKQEVIRSLMK